MKENPSLTILNEEIGDEAYRQFTWLYLRVLRRQLKTSALSCQEKLILLEEIKNAISESV